MIDLTGVGGVWTAAVLPFHPDGTIDRDGFRDFVGWNTSHTGVNAVVVNAHASESGALEDHEYELLIEDARAGAAPGVAVVSGVMRENGHEAARLTARAERAGADAVLLFPPEGFAIGAPLKPQMYVDFVRRVADSTALPICYFQRPVRTGAGLASEGLRQLCAAVPQIIAVKEGSDDVFAYEQNVAALAELDRPVSVLTSNNRWLFGTLALGGNGVLSGVASVVPELLHTIVDALGRSDLPAAREANARLLPLISVFYRAPLIDMHNRMKAALHEMGVIGHAGVREPLIAVPPAERDEIVAALRAARIGAGHAR
ncbi:dihydrodipicolinate synthase family protein [Acrocarpospora catenulata]|uniref:dihydrodipicolinate synthase family protein n=1 Tax=Acrocarpospora catenulata TaxID=2836182 RepID=UPI001BDAF172|nr:dihydrodipicolinate synthase family protein [Acrocarpospora catenulata]